MPRRLKPGGIGQYWDEEGMVEVYASTCAHCQKITEFPSMRVMHDHVDVCRTCMKLICDSCATAIAKGAIGCVPWEKQMEYFEARERLWKDMGLTS